MWQIKEFKTVESRNAWIKANQAKYQIEIIYLNNSFGVEYKRLRRVY